MSTLTIAAAQSSSVKGDVAANVRHHLELVALAVEHGADVVIFPELSLTGYEPTIAAETAIEPDDPLVLPLQEFADRSQIVIMAGCPLQSTGPKPYIGMIILQPQQARAVYRKRFVHTSELPYFVASDDCVVLPIRGTTVGVAICADIGNPIHAADAARAGAKIYAAGVAKTPADVAQREVSMADYARQHGMLTVMANYASPTGGSPMGGRSAAWDERGTLLARAEPQGECLVLAQSTADGWAASVVKS